MRKVDKLKNYVGSFNVFMKPKYFSLLFFFILSTKIASAQNKGPVDEQMIWAAYYNSIALNSKFSINSDIQGRTKGWYQHWSQALIRTGLNYKINDKISITGGLADFFYFEKNNILNRNEWRFWEEIAYTQKRPKLQIIHRFRTEQRFFNTIENKKIIQNSIEFNRFRYRFEIQISIKNETSILFGNEFMLTTKSDFSNPSFDQNRIYTGVNKKLNDNFMLQIQLVLIQQKSTDNDPFNETFVIRTNLYHTIKLKRSDDGSKK